MTDLIGQKLGSYQIVEQIGMGGMATVYKAYQASMDRFVAIKVLPQQLATDPSFIGRFEQEARTIAKLEHKNILPVHDFGAQDGYTYLVMRYVGLGTLKDLTQKGSLPLPDAVTYICQMADALHYAHQRGVIHRDVKTSNMLLGDGDMIYLTDFGIAKLAQGTEQFTGTGTIIGTPAYMSPEQCSGLPVDARSDIYSLGIVLYEAITGVVPFEAETPVAVVLKHLHEALPSPRRTNPNLPETIEKVILRALAKDPNERFQTADEMGRTLRHAFEQFTGQQTIAGPVPAARGRTAINSPTSEAHIEETVMVSKAGSSRRNWLPIALILALLIVSGVVLALVFGGDDEDDKDDDAANPTIAVMVTEEATSEAPITTVMATEEAAPSVAPTTVMVTEEAIELTDAPGWTLFTNARAGDPADEKLVVVGDFIWMATDGGLLRWSLDGTYTKFTTGDGLSYNSIQSIAADSTGDVWLAGGSDQPGVMRVRLADDGSIEGVDYFGASNGLMNDDNVWVLLPEPDGRMLAGVYGSYLAAWDGQSWSVPTDQVTGLDAIGDRVWSLLRDSDGTLFAGGPNGLMRWGTDSWEAVPLPENITSQGDEEYDVSGMILDPVDGSIWMNIYAMPSYMQHIAHLTMDEAGETSWIPVEDWMPAPIQGMRHLDDGTLWVAGYDVVLRVDPSGQRTTFTADQGLRGSSYHALVQDSSGTIWVSTQIGLARNDDRRWISYEIQPSIPSQSAIAAVEDPAGAVWALTDYGILTTYQADGWQVVSDLAVSTSDLASHGSDIWIAAASGVIRLDTLSGETQTYADVTEVRALAFDDQNILWIGTNTGLFQMNEDVITPVDAVSSSMVKVLYIDPQGVLWVGTGHEYDGPGDMLVLRQNADGTFETVASVGSPFAEDELVVREITSDGQGGLMVGTDSFIYHWDGSTWERFGGENGGPNYEPVTGLVLRGNVIWISTAYNGLWRKDAGGWLSLGREGTGTTYTNVLLPTSDGALWVFAHNAIARLIGDPVEN